MTKLTMGESIRNYRESIKMKRHRAAIVSDMSEGVFNAIEKDRNIPRVDTLCKMCRGMKCTPNDLIPKWMYTEDKNEN